MVSYKQEMILSARKRNETKKTKTQWQKYNFQQWLLNVAYVDSFTVLKLDYFNILKKLCKNYWSVTL